MRPTSDRTREALFNILAGGRLAARLEGARVLDAFAGTGALGLEALSRGAREVVFMESLAVARAALAHNIEALEEEDRTEVLAADVLRPPKAASPAAFVLMDPPYGQGLAGPAIEALERAGWIGADSLVVVELLAGEAFAAPAGFTILDQRKYGKARLVFLRSARARPQGKDSLSFR